MIVTGLHHFSLTGTQETIESCITFYSSVLNLRIGFRPPFDRPGFWLYAGEQPVVQLIVSDNEESYNLPTFARLAFACVNLPVTIRRLEDLGIDYTTNHIPDIDQFQVFLSDPAGFLIELNFSCEKL